MNLDRIKDKIRIAREAVKDEVDPYKTAAFQVILSKLIDDDQIVNLHKKKHAKSTTSESMATAQPINFEEGKEKLAENCDISTKELDEVFYFTGDLIKIVAPLSGNDAEKQSIVAKCVLTAYDVIFGRSWVKALDLSRCIGASKVGQLNHLAENLRKDQESFRLHGERRGAEYKITEEGKATAFEIIKKLAKGET